MARTEAGTLLTQAHGRQQLALRAATIRDIIKLYPMWNPFEPGSLERFVQVVTLLTQQRATNSAALAARYYEMFKSVDLGLTMGKAVALAEPATAAEIEAAIRATAVAGFWRGMGAGQTTEQALNNGLVQLAGSISREVLNGGRDTIVNEVQRDPDASGWIRVSDGDPCAFCAMLLSRGPVYKEESAGFEAHDHCACGAEPVYRGSKWPAANQKYHELWNETKRDMSVTGTSNDALNAFRRALTKGSGPAE
jgi:hypothetical protein